MACRAISESLSRSLVRADCSSVESDFVDAVVDRVAALTERSHNRPRRPKCNPLSRRSRPRETVAGLIGLSEKQYQVSASLARNYRFFLSSAQPHALDWRDAGSPAQAGDLVARALVDWDRRFFRRRAGGGFSFVTPGAAFLSRGLQRAFGEGPRRLFGLKLFLELGRPRLELFALRVHCLVLLGDTTLYRDDLLLGALQRRALRLQRLGQFCRSLIERRADGVDFRVRGPSCGQVLLNISERRVSGFRGERAFDRPLLETSNFSFAFAQARARFRQKLLGRFRTGSHRAELFSQVRCGQPVRFGGVEVSGFELGVGRPFLSQCRLKLLHAPGQIVASALEVAHLPVELRAISHKLFAPCAQRLVLLRHESILVLQRRPLLLDLLKALLLGAELRPNRRQLFAYGMEAPFVVFELPLGALQFRLPLRELRASLRGAGLGGGKRFLDIL